MEKQFHKDLWEKLDFIIKKALKNHVFTTCSIGFIKRGESGISRYVKDGYSAGEKNGEVRPQGECYFDLASLTKPLVTSLSILSLIEEKKISIDDNLGNYFGSAISGKEIITIDNLLTHSSGLPSHRPYYKELLSFPENKRKGVLLNWIMKEKLSFQPGTDSLYSDLDFILLGYIIEKVSGESLDKYWWRKIIKPLGLEKGLFFKKTRKEGNGLCVATGECGWSKMKLCGIVHDDNCRALGGVAGHAGLFGSCSAVLSLCENLLMQFQGEERHPAYTSSLLRKVLSRKKGNYVFGFDTPTEGVSSSGKYFSDMTVGHLGFTGTSFWIDLEQQIAIVFLTNRVFCGDDLNEIKQLRPIIHDSIMEELTKKPG